MPPSKRKFAGPKRRIDAWPNGWSPSIMVVGVQRRIDIVEAQNTWPSQKAVVMSILFLKRKHRETNS